MDAAGVALSVVTGFAFADQNRCAASNDYIIEAVRRYPDRLIGLGAVQPLAGDKAVYEVERCLNAGLRGSRRASTRWAKFRPDRPKTFRGFGATANGA